MKAHLITFIHTYRDGKSPVRLAIAVILLVICPFLQGVSNDIFFVAAMVTGLCLFYYSILRPWESVRYYGIMALVFLILFILLVTFGVGIMVKMNLPGHGAEDMAWLTGAIFFFGIVAGCFGMFRFRK